MESALKLDFDGAHGAEAPAPPAPKRRRGHPGGSMGEKSRRRLAADGVEIDDPERPTEGKRRKPGGVVTGPGLRDAPGIPLRNRGYDQVARYVAAGLPDLDAWVTAGYSPHSRQWLDVTRHEDFVARVREFQEADRTASPVSLNFLQQRLLNIALSDPGNFYEHTPHSNGRLRAKDILSLPPELRAAISEVGFDRNGKTILKFHDRARAISELMRTLAPQKMEVSGPNGGPLDVALSILVDRLFAPEMLKNADPETLNALAQVQDTLRLIADKNGASASPAGDDGAIIDGECVEASDG